MSTISRDLETHPAEPGTSPSIRVEGDCRAIFAYDIGFQIDLGAARERLHGGTQHRVVRLRRPAPAWFEYDPPPLRLTTQIDGIDVGGGATTEPQVEITLYEFGAAVVAYRLPVAGDAGTLAGLSGALYDNEPLLADSRSRVESLLELVRPAVRKPGISPMVEDYVIFAIHRWNEGELPAELLERHGPEMARVLQAEAADLAPEQIVHALGSRMAYTREDLTVVDWNAAILFDREGDDVIAVLQHANVELLELRLLDAQLDRLLEGAQELLSRLSRRGPWPSFHEGRLLRDFAELETDGALLFEGVNNAIKLLGDQYLARFYRMVAGKLDLPAWNASVARKLQIAESIYQKMTDAKATRRLELLEIVIIVLIAISILLAFVPGLGGK